MQNFGTILAQLKIIVQKQLENRTGKAGQDKSETHTITMAVHLIYFGSDKTSK